MMIQTVIGFVSALAFVLEFPVDSNVKQDYFYFEGRNESAYLSRINDTVTLYIEREGNFSYYTTETNQSSFIFSWSGFKMNGIPMSLNKSEGTVYSFSYTSYLFLSPIIDYMSDCGTSCPEQVFTHIEGVNYWYITR